MFAASGAMSSMRLEPRRRSASVGAQAQIGQPCQVLQRRDIRNPVAIQIQRSQPGQVAQRGHVYDPVVPQPQIGQPGQALQGREVGNVVFVQIQEVQPGRVFQPRQIDDVLIVGGQPRQVRQFGAGDRLAPMLVQFPLKHRAKVGVGDVAVSVPVCARAASGNARGGISAVF